MSAPPAQFSPTKGNSVARNSGRFHFDGGAGTYFGTAILGAIVTVCTLGFCYPFALVLRERWKAKHSYIDGKRLTFTGSAMGLFGTWVKWLLLSFLTLGVYLFWIAPRITKWKWENTDFDPTWQQNTLPAPSLRPLSQSAPADPMRQLDAPQAHWGTPTS
ncbi:DUF898 domain-containing protein [Rhodococcus sp. X156]|uniref:DUF898 domain-containing protein n=1 Tax=Rhodococcus sp. X156 TaxID=2499145 RepID=UPI001F4998CF|nr:DUF898 domain-containing protein [Rhodococcus sp. X156]